MTWCLLLFDPMFMFLFNIYVMKLMFTGFVGSVPPSANPVLSTPFLVWTVSSLVNV